MQDLNLKNIHELCCDIKVHLQNQLLILFIKLIKMKKGLFDPAGFG